jgi:light-regulated signal transduction histidine kinase (bacteriophytochrome)
MTRAPTFDEIFAVMSAASVGDTEARVAVPDDPQVNDLATKFAIAVNLLLDDLNFRAAQVEAVHRDTQMELERLVAERTLELTNLNEELEAFSYSVSHDLRAPLRAADGFSRILVEDFADQLTPDATRYLHLIRTNTQQMGQLIDDLLAFARLSRQPLTTQTIAPADLVRKVLADLHDEHPDRRVEIQIDDLPVCRADPSLFQQVFVNLLGNAFKFTRQREIGQIEIGCDLRDGVHVYFVKDNGIGFDMQYVHKLFGVFQRLHRAEDYEGTGVGLATVQRIIRRHGGHIWAESEVNQGTTIYFTLEGDALNG